MPQDVDDTSVRVDDVQLSAALCGDGVLEGSEECDPPDGTTCGSSCRFIAGSATDCQACLSESCRASVPTSSAQAASMQNLFAACYQLDGVAAAGPAAGTPLRQLCADVVACFVRTGCEVEPKYVPRNGTGNPPDEASCYCGKQLLNDDSGQALAMTRCRDGLDDASGPCRIEFERAAESSVPGAVLAAINPTYGKPALTAALHLLMSDCG